MNQKLFPSEPNHPGWPMRLSQVYEHFGLHGRAYKLPSHSLPTILIQGIPVWVEAPKPHPTGRKSSTHRVMAACPACGFICSLGRLHQHAKVHK